MESILFIGFLHFPKPYFLFFHFSDWCTFIFDTSFFSKIKLTCSVGQNIFGFLGGHTWLHAGLTPVCPQGSLLTMLRYHIRYHTIWGMGIKPKLDTCIPCSTNCSAPWVFLLRISSIFPLPFTVFCDYQESYILALSCYCTFWFQHLPRVTHFYCDTEESKQQRYWDLTWACARDHTPCVSPALFLPNMCSIT